MIGRLLLKSDNLHKSKLRQYMPQEWRKTAKTTSVQHHPQQKQMIRYEIIVIQKVIYDGEIHQTLMRKDVSEQWSYHLVYERE